jgi:hypothetical protein
MANGLPVADMRSGTRRNRGKVGSTFVKRSVPGLLSMMPRRRIIKPSSGNHQPGRDSANGITPTRAQEAPGPGPWLAEDVADDLEPSTIGFLLGAAVEETAACIEA